MNFVNFTSANIDDFINVKLNIISVKRMVTHIRSMFDEKCINSVCCECQLHTNKCTRCERERIKFLNHNECLKLLANVLDIRAAMLILSIMHSVDQRVGKLHAHSPFQAWFNLRHGCEMLDYENG